MTISASADARPITEAELQARLDAHARSIEHRLNDQRSEVARLISEATRAARDEIGVMKARIADQDAEIAQLHKDLERQRRADGQTFTKVSEVSGRTHFLAARIEKLESTLATVETSRRNLVIDVANLGYVSHRQDDRISDLEGVRQLLDSQIFGLKLRMRGLARRTYRKRRRR